jgi:hypothetical protein
MRVIGPNSFGVIRPKINFTQLLVKKELLQEKSLLSLRARLYVHQF